MSSAARTINFTLNGRPVTADVKPHHNVVEMLQTQFALFGARICKDRSLDGDDYGLLNDILLDCADREAALFRTLREMVR